MIGSGPRNRVTRTAVLAFAGLGLLAGSFVTAGPVAAVSTANVAPPTATLSVNGGAADSDGGVLLGKQLTFRVALPCCGQVAKWRMAPRIAYLQARTPTTGWVSVGRARTDLAGLAELRSPHYTTAGPRSFRALLPRAGRRAQEVTNAWTFEWVSPAVVTVSVSPASSVSGAVTTVEGGTLTLTGTVTPRTDTVVVARQTYRIGTSTLAAGVYSFTVPVAADGTYTFPDSPTTWRRYLYTVTAHQNSYLGRAVTDVVLQDPNVAPPPPLQTVAIDIVQRNRIVTATVVPAGRYKVYLRLHSGGAHVIARSFTDPTTGAVTFDHLRVKFGGVWGNQLPVGARVSVRVTKADVIVAASSRAIAIHA